MNTTATVGWVPEPDGRGTAGLLTSCIFTIFLSTWTAYHPDMKRSWSAAFWDKVLITIGTIIAPECIIYLAMCDWNRVKKLQFIFRSIQVEPLTKCESPKAHHSLFGHVMSRTDSKTDPNDTEKCNSRHSSTKYDQAGITISPSRPLTITHAHFLRMGGFCVRSTDGEILQAHHKWDNNRISVKSVCILRAANVSITSVPVSDIKDKSKSDGISKLFALGQISWLFLHLIARTASSMPVSTLELFTASNGACAVVSYLFWWSKPKDVAQPLVLQSAFTAAEILKRQQSFLDASPDLAYPRKYRYARWTVEAIGSWLANLEILGWNFPFPTYTEQIAWRSLSIFLPIWALSIWQIGEWDEKLKFSLKPKIRKKIVPIALTIYGTVRLYFIVEIFTGLRETPAALYGTVDWTQYILHV
ncbi:hypothetical protein EG328_003386 [Venturia inaequalis]|uniref:Uncharacterized protein n=1 Tax=Venturia inaequalis TaxID=5025 RepID=A0A8H3VGJ2_VENIN|nr:hypothetical protein EG328_003386 [Venturia inaequalis]RDI85267.1 hypothetical protein Vi05172_g4718 [Venturia inaequalis]